MASILIQNAVEVQLPNSVQPDLNQERPLVVVWPTNAKVFLSEIHVNKVPSNNPVRLWAVLLVKRPSHLAEVAIALINAQERTLW